MQILVKRLVACTSTVCGREQMSELSAFIYNNGNQSHVKLHVKTNAQKVN